jgi:hypothetical protein
LNGTFASIKTVNNLEITFNRSFLLLFFGLVLVLLHNGLNLFFVGIIVVWRVRIDPFFTSHDEFDFIGVQNVDLVLVSFSFA